jgi:alkylation response protein AidB-like acyl-CoA dehydrogenase
VTTTDVLAAAGSVAAELSELAAENDRTAMFPNASIAVLHRAGLLTATVGAAHGGPGLRHGGLHRLLVVLGAADPSVALVAAQTLAFHQREAVAPTLAPDRYAVLLAEARERPVLVNALQVEPALGTPSRGGLPATVARRVGDGWRITGHKTFSTGAPGLRWMSVLARTDESTPRIGTFLVDAGAPGIGIRATWAAMGMRATRSDDVLFDDTPVHCVQDLADPGPRRPDPAIGPGTAIPSIYLGVARSAVRWLVGYLRDRTPTNLGHPLVELPRFRTALGEFAVRLRAAQDLLCALADRADTGEPVDRNSAWAAKTVANRASVEVVQQAVALIGNPGLSADNPLERHLRDVLCARVHFPQEDTAVETLGAAVIEQEGIFP